MPEVLRGAVCHIIICYTVFAGYLLFGSKTYGDVLKNLNFSFVSGLVPRALAHALIDVVAFCYTFNLLVNFCLKASLASFCSFH